MSELTVSESTRLYTPAERVWRHIGDFLAIDRWHPRVLSCKEAREGTQKVRRLNIPAESELVERLESHDDAAMQYEYTVVSGPLPVRDARGRLWVHRDTAGSCTIHWELRFYASGVTRTTAVTAVRDHIRAGLDTLRFSLAG